MDMTAPVIDERTLHEQNNPTSSSSSFETICHYTELAIFHSGGDGGSSEDVDVGLEALSQLSELCKHRIPYDFDDSTTIRFKDDHSMMMMIHRFDQLIPPKAVATFLRQLQSMEENGWLSTNPDSVDGLPSFHLNLVSNGLPMFSSSNEEKTTTTKEPFQMGVQKLLSIVRPYIYHELLPGVQELLNSTSIQISDVFLRRYGQDLCGSEVSRNGISAHYDVLSRVTAVIALDDVAADGRNGLFTTQMSKGGATSNHAALRRFFPLSTGDGVVHTWDVLHGVDVEAGLDRTSLIVWFTENATTTTCDDGVAESDILASAVSPAPWILQHPQQLETDSVAQFVLASALSSSIERNDDEKDSRSDFEDQLYLKSAAKGNAFALTRMGSLVEEGVLSTALKDDAIRVLDSLRSLDSLPDSLRELLQRIEMEQEEQQDDCSLLAMRFWFEGAIRGNPMAQKSLGDEIMFHATKSAYNNNNEAVCVLAATCFALAAQQGDAEALDSLSRVIEYDVQNRHISSDEAEFLNSPVVKVAMMASYSSSTK